MKRFSLILIAFLAIFVGGANAADLTNARWYTIKVGNGGYLSFKSGYKDGAYLLLNNTTEDTEDTGLWTFIGNETDGYKFYNKARGGNYVLGMSGTEANARAKMVAESNTTNVTTFDMGKNGEGFWIKDHGSANKYWNKRGNYLAYWDNASGSTDTGSRFIFTIQGIPDFFSGEGEEKFYYITFANSSLVLQDMGSAKNVTTQSRKYGEASQLWKLVGNETGFQLINKGSGRYAYYDGSRVKTRQTADANGFTIEATTNTNYTGKYEISWIGAASQTNRYFNQWGGTGAGKEIGLWQAADGNNILYLVAEADVQPTEFCVGQKGSRPTDIHDFSLWYDVPATATGVSDTWMEYSLPMGNGQIGATIRGGVLEDNIQFNEKTLWSATATNSGNQGYFQNFGSILVKDKSDTFSATASDGKPIENYNRYLDIINGVAGVNFQSPDHQFTFSRRYFASATDKVFVAHYEATYESVGQEIMDLDISYAPDGQISAGSVTYTMEDDGTASATFSGKMQIVSYNTRFKVESNGTIVTNSNGINVSGASWVNIIMAAATDYDASKPGCKSGASAADLQQTVATRIDEAVAKGFGTLFADHKAAHSALMNRVNLNLGGSSKKTTEALIKYYNASDQNKTSSDGLFLESLYFQYGRYLTIGANLDTSIHAPSNLQGIWNDRSNTSFWHCDIHADINVQMNYWPADPANLSEMHLPFLNHILDLGAPDSNSPWYQLAKSVKGANGWMVAVENNIFGGTSNWCNGSIKTCGSWYCTHLWRYYKYTMDREFLKKALPVMYQCALFTKSIATKDSKGLYEITGEWSPEHGPTDVTAFAQQTSYEALDEVMKGHAELGDESPLTASQIAAIQDLYDNFDRGLWTETYNGKTCISEWKNNPLSDPGHRHLSHLMCLFPFSQVSAFDQTTEGKKFFQAAYNGQIARNGDVTGWSMGWQTNTYSRCLDGDRARKNLSLALRHSGSYVIEMGNYGGCYYNLYDAHSPFQIDGNYGCTSGICEMLLQSYDDIITLLPALPTAWKTQGSVSGLKAQGNFTVSESWQNGTLTSASITSNAGQPLRIRYAKLSNAGYKFRLNGESVAPIADGDIYTIPGVKEGDVVTIDFDSTTGIDVNSKFKIQNSKKLPTYTLSGKRIAHEQKGCVLVQEGRKFIR